MRCPNFLVLDEPTNDLDIMTLNILEDYLQHFKGCVLVVSHDRYFMDKIVDHLLVFEGDAKIRDYPGNYTQYRDWCDEKEDIERQKKLVAKNENRNAGQAPSATLKNERPRKLTYKEQKEFEGLEKEIENLEKEKSDIEAILGSGNLSGVEIEQHSIRFSELSNQIEEKTNRWMELSEIGA